MRARHAGVLKGMQMQGIRGTTVTRQVDQLGIRRLSGQAVVHVGSPHQLITNLEGSELCCQDTAKLIIVQEDEDGAPRTLSGSRMGCGGSLPGPQGHVFGKWWPRDGIAAAAVERRKNPLKALKAKLSLTKLGRRGERLTRYYYDVMD